MTTLCLMLSTWRGCKHFLVSSSSNSSRDPASQCEQLQAVPYEKGQSNMVVSPASTLVETPTCSNVWWSHQHAAMCGGIANMQQSGGITNIHPTRLFAVESPTCSMHHLVDTPACDMQHLAVSPPCSVVVEAPSHVARGGNTISCSTWWKHQHEALWW